MKVTEYIKSNPYVKASNCTDAEDCQNGINAIRLFEKAYGNSKTLDKLFNKLFDKKQSYEVV